MPLTSEQLAMRRTMVTATDLVILSGTYPGEGRGPCSIYLEKTGEADAAASVVDEAASEAMALGHLLEPVILSMLASKRSLVLRPGKTVRHAEHTWLGATPDAEAVTPPWPVLDGHALSTKTLSECAFLAPCEAKAVGRHRVWHWDDGPPEYVHVQAQTQMTVTGAKHCYVAALLGTELRTYVLEHSAELEEMLVETARRFWFDHVLARRMPEPDGTDAAWTLIRDRFPTVRRPEVIVATADVDALAREILALAEARREADKRERALKQKLAELVGDWQGVRGDGWRALFQERAGYHVEAHDVAASRVLDLRAVATEAEKAAKKLAKGAAPKALKGHAA